jgi:hypothetical protein
MNSVPLPHFDSPRRVTRRTFLRGTGVALSLPWLDAMMPRAFAAEESVPRRMIVILNDMGFMPQFFFPEGEGRNYQASPYLDLLKDFRNDTTILSGVSHPGVDGGHAADICFLTGAPHPGRSGFRNTISLDQYAAERIGIATRFPSLNLLIGHEQTQSLAWTADGVRIPPENKPSALFAKLFLQGNAQQVEAQVKELREGRSILDTVADRAKGLGQAVGPDDRSRLDQYFTAVRELEQRMVKAEEWERKPKPAVKTPPPVDITDINDTLGRSRLMYDMMRLAIETDSTRLITVVIQDFASTHLVPNGEGHHVLTHHGNRPEQIAKLRSIEEGQLRVLGELLGGLRNAKEQGATLLDRTMVLSGAAMGNANAHSNSNLPVMLIGGGFRHGQNLVFDKKRNLPLANLYVSMLQRLGIEADRFSSGTGTLRGLEMA